VKIGGVRSKKFELILPEICKAGGIPPKPPFRPPTEATLSDWTISSFSLAANSLSNVCVYEKFRRPPYYFIIEEAKFG